MLLLKLMILVKVDHGGGGRSDGRRVMLLGEFRAPRHVRRIVDVVPVGGNLAVKVVP